MSGATPPVAWIMKEDAPVKSVLNRALLIVLLAATALSCGPWVGGPVQTGMDAAGDVSVSLGRPRIADNTLVGSDGRRLRGGTLWLYGWIGDKKAWAMSEAVWQSMRDHRLNVVRVACAYRPERENNLSLEQYEALLDTLIDRAEASGIYVIIDFHPRPGSYDMTAARTFWNRIARRYRDRPNVIYELINEPVFSRPDDYTDQTLRDFEELWRLVHELAPDTPAIVMTFCQVGDTGRTPAQVVDALRGIDWSKTAVGFHSYWRDSSERIVDLKRHYPCINTEFYNFRPNARRREMQIMDGHAYHATLME